jgi:hypothetical protein
MIEYININTLAYPVGEGDIRLEYPNIPEDQTGESFPCPEGYALVKFVQPPQYNWETHRLYADAPSQDADGWRKVWRLRSLTDLEKQQQAELLVKLQEI